jgi:LPS-assembly lipoprotein
MAPRGIRQRGWVSAGARLALLVAASLAVLAGCGFRMQGKVPLPAVLGATWIETDDAQSDFVQDLRRALAASGAALAPRRAEATAVLRVERDELLERVLSVSGRNVPREYELTYVVRFSVEGAAGTLLPAEEVSVSREFSFDERAVLAKEREQEVLRAALARDLAGVVLNRLASLK